METQKVIDTTATALIAVKQILYTGKVHTDGGRDGYARSEDGRLDINLSSPGSKDKGTNPEQLFAAGWSACFIGAMRLSASRLQIAMPKEVSVDAEVDLTTGDDGYLLQARLHVNLPGLSFEQAKALVEGAHQNCPYSKATRGNINVTIHVIYGDR